MAKSNTSPIRDLVEDGNTVTISTPRRLIALESTWEIQKLCTVIAKLVPLGDDQNFFAVRGIAARMYELAEVGMSALSDECELTSDLARRLRFEECGG